MNLDLSTLNESQHSAVLDTEGAVLVFAGAGSGKTRVLTHRVAHLISKGVSPWNILAITFTNKAAKEMQERLNHMLGADGADVWVSTFHSFCAKVLFVNGEKLGYTQNFSILDESGAMRMLKRVLREKHMDDKEKDKIRSHISAAKNAGMTPDDYNAEIRDSVKEANLICDCFERYNEILAQNNAMDFDDLQLKALELFKNFPEVLEKYSRKFRYIHVDEFQDTNNVQLELVKLLCGYWKNIFVVGDDDQSIYSWRGANVKNILDFEKIFDEVKIHKLMQNYRSTGAILETANNVIQNNTARQEKQLFTAGSKGVRVEYQTCYNEHQEARWVLENIKNLVYYNNHSLSDFAILTRVNSLSRLYEMKLRDTGFSYQVLGGYRFFERKEILDVVAYLKLLVNPADSDAIMRVINFPGRGIGDTTQERLLEYARNNGIRVYDAIMDIKNAVGLSEGIKTKITVFRDLLCELTYAKGQLGVDEFVKYLVEKVNFEKEYTESKTKKEDDANRYENIKEFISYVEETVKKNTEITLEEFLQTITLDTEKSVESDEKVTIATMHSAKGLEFRVVFIVGCEEGIFPSERSMKEGGLEEERRVMYVAVTRAKERLYISCATQRGFGSSSKGVPSRFFYEAQGMRKEEKKLEHPSSERMLEASYKKIGYDEAVPMTPKTQQNSSAAKSFSGYTQSKPTVYNKDTDGFAKGDRVSHPRYGEGIIVDLDGVGTARTAAVLFKGLGMKKFALANAPLKPLS